MNMLMDTKTEETRLKLMKFRAQKGWTRQKLAYLIGISPPTYSRKENGLQDFYRHEIDALLKLFDCKYEDIFT